VTGHIDKAEVKAMLERDGRVKTAKHYRLSESAIYRLARAA
jgi:Mor family transcriptional regulator